MDLVEKQGPEYMEKQGGKGEQNLPRTIQTIYETADKNFGILSLSDLATSTCMWKRYADQGRGFLVEFDSAHRWFNQKISRDDDFRHLRRISYVTDRTPAYLLGITAQAYSYTKETKWEYESGWRIILNFNSAACKVGKDNTATDVLLFAIPPDCLLSVTVGYNASPEFIEEVRTALGANPSLSHVHLNAAKRFDRTTPRAGITYLITPENNVYFNYSEGFRVPTSDELFAFARALADAQRLGVAKIGFVGTDQYIQ